MGISIEADGRGLIVKTPYSPRFVSELKRLVPVSEREFTGNEGKPPKAWIVSPSYGQTIGKIVKEVFGVFVHIPAAKAGAGKLERVEVRLEYLGACKQRGDGSVSAFGHDGTGWTLIAPESVLRDFFNPDSPITVDGVESGSQVKSGPSTLYQALLIKPDAGPLEIKAAYRRMARLVHPDVNHEPDAAEQFKAVQRAYEILSEPMKRRRYDAGLALEVSLKQKQVDIESWPDLAGVIRHQHHHPFFRSPLRCGLLTIDGERKLGRVVISKIHRWDDITNDKGQVMVSSWNANRETYEVNWA